MIKALFSSVNLKGYLIAGAAGFALSAIVTGAATVKVYEDWIVPKREKAVEVRVKLDVTERIAAAEIAAAEIAKNAEAKRQRAIAEAGLKLFKQQYDERQREANERLEELERENDAYVERLKKAGRFRPLNGADIDFLRGVRDKAN